MSTDFQLNAEKREDMGKGASRRLRRAGRVPAIVYGLDQAPEAISMTQNQVLKHLENEAFYSQIITVNLDGKSTQAVLRDLQRHPFKSYIVHMDLQRVDMNKPVHVHVPLHFINEETCVGVKAGGMVSHEVIEVEISCLPKDLPEFIEVDIANLNVGDSLHLSDLQLPAGTSLLELARGEDHDLAVVTIHAKKGGGEEVEGETEGEAEEGGA
ncbi:MAG: 50S ribosomal protein L25/general stress protein Ctc [Gammaproteobacteria bacterium]|nr:50S ribosomal protein L25/general stress protein Ctc [Gammaproteobacteria bacterium]